MSKAPKTCEVCDNQCQFCGGCSSDRELDIHHINYDKQDCREDNLIALCRACNTRANYYSREAWTMIFNEKVRLFKLGYKGEWDVSQRAIADAAHA